MTREEAIARIREHKIVHKMNEPRAIHISEALDMAIKALEQKPCEDCISKKAVLDKINEVCFSREQESVDFRVAQGSNGQRDLIINFIENLPSVQLKPKTEVLDKIRAEIRDWQTDIHDNEYDAETHDFVFERIYEIIDELEAESEERMPPERDCVNCVNSKDGHMDFSETCHNCMWENQFIPKFMPKRIKASDIQPDDEWMQDNEWDEIYAKENLPDINVGNIKESEE